MVSNATAKHNASSPANDMFFFLYPSSSIIFSAIDRRVRHEGVRHCERIWQRSRWHTIDDVRAEHSKETHETDVGMCSIFGAGNVHFAHSLKYVSVEMFSPSRSRFSTLCDCSHVKRCILNLAHKRQIPNVFVDVIIVVGGIHTPPRIRDRHADGDCVPAPR